MSRSEMPACFAGSYVDGHSGGSHAVTVSVFDDSLDIEFADGSGDMWPIGEISLVPYGRNGGWLTLQRRHGPPARLRLPAIAYEALTMHSGPPQKPAALARLRPCLLPLLILLSGIAFTLSVLLPGIAARMGSATSPELEMAAGHQRYERFIERSKRRNWGSVAYCIGEQGQAALNRLTETLTAAQPPVLQPRIIVIRSRVDNAYSLSGGYVVLTSRFLSLLKNQTELAGVIAHEIGHNEARHHTRTAIETGAGLGVAGFLFHSTLGAWNYMLTGTGSSLALRSREMEREADRFSINMLRKAGLNPGALGDYMQRAAEEEGDEADFFSSTHPTYAERVQLFRAAATAGRDILTGEQWTAIRRMCRETTETAPQVPAQF